MDIVIIIIIGIIASAMEGYNIIHGYFPTNGSGIREDPESPNELF